MVWHYYYRSMSSKDVNLWFENYRGGQSQGRLHPGQVTTSNAYQGHVFFATDIANKSREIARFNIIDTTVSECFLNDMTDI